MVIGIHAPSEVGLIPKECVKMLSVVDTCWSRVHLPMILDRPSD